MMVFASPFGRLFRGASIRLLLLVFLLPRPGIAQNAICPIGFVWGGLCGFGTFCPPSLPPFHCLRGSCCRDQRPLFARLGPIVYPQDLLGLGGIGNGLGIGGFCFDSALNCALYISVCFAPIYRVCMMTHCRRTCGFCGLGALGLGGMTGFGTTGLGLNGLGFNGLTGGFGLNGLTGLNGLNGLGGFAGIG